MTTFRLEFGQHKGKLITEVPDDYLDYIRTATYRQFKNIDAEVERREKLSNAAHSVLDELLRSGYRSLAQRMVNEGASDEQLKELEHTYEQSKNRR
jgi:hypothetical protein